jgi:Protein of unknown function (DUF2484)
MDFSGFPLTDIISPPAIAACLWVLAATVTAFLPMRRQYPPGITLLIAAPLILIWLGYQHGFWVAAISTAGFLSMFRNPLIYFARRALGLPTRLPDDPAPSTPAPSGPDAGPKP